MWLDILIGAVTAVVASWLALVIALVILRPKGPLLGEAIRILPDGAMSAAGSSVGAWCSGS